ncbi:hypothetical protein [Nocardiopsis chromatogenes]|uniref:hypothetical protein n=1 Tax=Nocardiopsis chromatogenes TaxID=280239 RepID=UPI000344B1BC|nr:hypothetical protein [Nocardiopsis chromatogenes]
MTAERWPGGDPVATARRVAERALEVADVVELSAGSYGTTATLGAGVRVKGVWLHPDEVRVGVVVRYGRPVPDIAAEVREAVRPEVPGRAVHVEVEDVVAGAGGPAGPGR